MFTLHLRDLKIEPKLITKIENKIIDLLNNTLYQSCNQVNLKKFSEHFEAMIQDQKNEFKSKPWLWHDVVRPSLMFLLGII